MKRSETIPVLLPFAVFLFDVLATILVLGSEAQAQRAFSGQVFGLILLPGSLFLSGGSAVAFNVGLAGCIQWLLRRYVGDKRKIHDALQSLR